MSATAAARHLVWLDLCSGLGGASAPALDRGWQVTRVDIHKWKLPPSPDRAALRGKIPYEIGEAICRAVEQREAGEG